MHSFSARSIHHVVAKFEDGSFRSWDYEATGACFHISPRANKELIEKAGPRGEIDGVTVLKVNGAIGRFGDTSREVVRLKLVRNDTSAVMAAIAAKRGLPQVNHVDLEVVGGMLELYVPKRGSGARTA